MCGTSSLICEGKAFSKREKLRKVSTRRPSKEPSHEDLPQTEGTWSPMEGLSPRDGGMWVRWSPVLCNEVRPVQWLETTEFILPQCWRSEVQKSSYWAKVEVLAGLAPLQVLRGGPVPSPCSALRGHLHPLAHGLPPFKVTPVSCPHNSASSNSLLFYRWTAQIIRNNLPAQEP